MIERIAQTLEQVLVQSGCYASTGTDGKRYCYDSYDEISVDPEVLARAALAAIREPSGIMLKAFDDYNEAHMTGGEWAITEAWADMIDAALEEK